MACVIASAPVHAVRVFGRPSVSSGSRSASDGDSSGCQMQNFMPFSTCVIIAVLSVSAPVPAVVGIVISLGKAAAISGVGCSYSKSHKSIWLFAVRQIALPPSMALPPPMAMMASWRPSMNMLRPALISSSRGFGEISEKMPEGMPASARHDVSLSIKGRPRLPRSVTINGLETPMARHFAPISASRPGP